MQAKCQNGVATSIWISRAHTLHVYPTNFLRGMMSNPSYEVYKCWQHSLMAERASPCPLVLGSGRKVLLSISADPPRPFSGVHHREGFHVFVDADLAPGHAQVACAGPGRSHTAYLRGLRPDTCHDSGQIGLWHTDVSGRYRVHFIIAAPTPNLA